MSLFLTTQGELHPIRGQLLQRDHDQRIGIRQRDPDGIAAQRSATAHHEAGGKDLRDLPGQEFVGASIPAPVDQIGCRTADPGLARECVGMISEYSGRLASVLRGGQADRSQRGQGVLLEHIPGHRAVLHPELHRAFLTGIQRVAVEVAAFPRPLASHRETQQEGSIGGAG